MAFISNIKTSPHKNSLHKNFIFIAQKMKFSIKDSFSKCDQILSFLRIWSYLLKKSLMKKFTFVYCNKKVYLHAAYQFTKRISLQKRVPSQFGEKIYEITLFFQLKRYIFSKFVFTRLSVTIMLKVLL